MKNYDFARRLGLKRLKALIAAAGIGVALGVGGFSSPATAATPPANTALSNVTTASYTDGNGVQQTTLSNIVQTIVQQVYSFALTPPTPGTTTPLAGYSKSGSPGSTLYTQYTITNTGNGTDSFTIAASGADFSTVAVFPDVTSSGQPSSSTPISGPVKVAGGASYSFVVAYTIPASASGVWSKTGTVVVTGNGTGPYPVTPSSLTRTDTITATANAAFSVNTALALPAIGMSAPSGATAPSSGPVGTYSVYTISYVNNGGTAGPVYIKDQLPAGFTYVTGTGTWSGAIATVLSEADASNPSGISYKVGSYTAGTGTLIEAVVQNVLPGQSGTLSFQVRAYAGTNGASTLVGTTSTNNTAAYTTAAPDAGTCTSPYTVTKCTGSTTVATNAAPFTVLATRGVTMTGSGTATTGSDATAPSGGNAAGDGTGDVVSISSGVPGAAVRYSFKVFNKGNDTDTFLLGVSSAALANTFPVGTTFSWFQADGVTPLQATAGKSSVDTGPLAAGADTTVILQVVVPAATAAPQTGTLAAPRYTATVQATSVNDSTIEDGAKAQLQNLSAGFVDLTQTSTSGTSGIDQGPGSATVVQGIAVTAGAAGNNATSAVGPTPAPAPSAKGSAVFTLNVNNNDTGALTFNLSASTTNSFPGTLPAGWTVDFYTDAAATAAAAGTAGARTTVSIAAAASTTVYAKVTPPSNAAVGTYDIYFQAKSTTNASSGALVSDYVHDQVVVAAAGSLGMNLGGSGALQASPGGSATYAHNLLNTGTGMCGSVATPLTLSVAGLPAGWTYSVYLDSGTVGVVDGESPLTGAGAGGSSPYTIGTLAAGTNLPVLVRVFPPASASVGDVGNATITVTDANNPGCGASMVSDSTTVVATGQLQVVKYQAVTPGACGAWSEPSWTSSNATAKPGDCLMFKAVATNVGTTSSTNVSLNDAVGAYTTWSATQPAAGDACVATGGSTPTLSTVASGAPAGTTFSCGTASLPPGGTLTMRFAEQINP